MKKSESKACRHCGSPQRFNPCWNGITINKGVSREAYEDPCDTDAWYEARRRDEVLVQRTIWGIVIAAVLVVALIFWSRGWIA
jgi:hypothetical protein